MRRSVHPISFYEWKTGSTDDNSCSDHYVIVLSSVLFGYGIFICINAIDIIL